MDKFKELTTRIRREMNGAVSASMRSLDPDHQRKINFGVSLTTIKQICQEYGKSHALAEKLREHDIREWWIAAAYVDTPEAVDLDFAESLAVRWKSSEEVNIYAMELLSCSHVALEIAKMWIFRSDPFRPKAAERIIACLAGKMSDSQAESFLAITSGEIAVRAIYEHHPSLRVKIREKGPYSYSWILDEIDLL